MPWGDGRTSFLPRGAYGLSDDGYSQFYLSILEELFPTVKWEIKFLPALSNIVSFGVSVNFKNEIYTSTTYFNPQDFIGTEVETFGRELLLDLALESCIFNETKFNIKKKGMDKYGVGPF